MKQSTFRVHMKMHDSVLGVVALLLFVAALSDLPYGFYTLLRIIVFLTAGYKAYHSYVLKRRLSPWLWIGIAIIFNPIVIIAMDREIWVATDIFTGLVFMFSALFAFRKAQSVNDPEITYLKSIEDYIESIGGNQDLLELQGTDREYCIAVMRLYKAGFTNKTSHKVIGALALDSVRKYHKNRNLSLLYLESLEKQLSDTDTKDETHSPDNINDFHPMLDKAASRFKKFLISGTEVPMNDVSLDLTAELITYAATFVAMKEGKKDLHQMTWNSFKYAIENRMLAIKEDVSQRSGIETTRDGNISYVSYTSGYWKWLDEVECTNLEAPRKTVTNMILKRLNLHLSRTQSFTEIFDEIVDYSAKNILISIERVFC